MDSMLITAAVSCKGGQLEFLQVGWGRKAVIFAKFLRGELSSEEWT